MSATPLAQGLAGETRHATSVEIDGSAILIEGPSGSGKSGLALQLIALGARLIADDRAPLALRDGWPWALAPQRLTGVIEARGIGLVQVPHSAGAPLRLIVDMATVEQARLPEPMEEIVLGQPVTRIRRVDGPAFPSAILALAKSGRWQDG